MGYRVGDLGFGVWGTGLGIEGMGTEIGVRGFELGTPFLASETTLSGVLPTPRAPCTIVLTCRERERESERVRE